MGSIYSVETLDRGTLHGPREKELESMDNFKLPVYFWNFPLTLPDSVWLWEAKQKGKRSVRS